MKNLFLSLLLLPFIFACNTAEKKGAKFTGNVTGLDTTFFILGGPGGSRDTLRVDAEGNFSYSLPDLDEMTNYFFLIGKSGVVRFKLEPGMDMKIKFDAADPKGTLSFEGKGADINNYVAAKAKATPVTSMETYKKEPDAYRAYQDSVLGVQKALLAGAVKDNPENPFWKSEPAELLYSWANNLAMYGPYHGYYAQVPGFQVPESFDAYKKELNVNNPDNVGSAAFGSYLSQYISEAASEQVKEMMKVDSTQTIDRDSIRLAVAHKLLTDNSVLDQYLYDYISGQVQWNDIDDKLQAVIDDFMANCKDPKLAARLKTTVDEWKRLGKGQPAIEFSGRDRDGNIVKLSDFRGKLVYVDVWATWCGPCKYEIPYLDTLETDYHGKNIAFISFSIDEDHDAWMKFVPEHHLQGTQIIGENAWQSQLCKDYKIMGVPTFMLFDQNGNIVSVKMTRPSNQETRDRIDALLQ
jgi:thiol-disulfide isomerase/thioredoxin